MAELLIALGQLASAGLDAGANLASALTAANEAAQRHAGLLLLPELWQIGYSPCPDDRAGREAWQARALGPGDPWLEPIFETARGLDLAILITFLERWPGGPRNVALLIDRHGQPALSYAKVHTCDFAMEAALTPGESFEVTWLDTRAGPVGVGNWWRRSGR